MKSSVMKIGPEQAAKLLLRNKTNRPIRQSRIAKFAGIMRRDGWKITHQSVAISPEGDLLDGQHRMLAIVESGKVVPIYVTCQVPTEAFAVMDDVAPRNMHDRTGEDKRILEVFSRAETVFYNRALAFDLFDGYVGSQLYETVKELIAHCGAVRQNMGRAGMRLAAAMAAIKYDNKQEIFEQYRALVLCDYDVMWPHTQAFCKKDAKKAIPFPAGGTATGIIFTYGTIVFDPSKSHRITYSIPTNEAVRENIAEYKKLYDRVTIKKP